MRHALVVVAGAAVIVGAAACGTSSTTQQTVTVTATPTPSAPVQVSPPPTATTPAPAATTSAASAASTHEPCELLTPELAAAFAGDDAQRQSSLDSNPPLPVPDTDCFYKGSMRSVLFSIGPMPTDPTAPVNHFHAIRAENRIAGVPYEAYWFAAGGSLLVVKDSLLVQFRVSRYSDPGGTQDNDDKADDIKLADQIMPRVG